MAKRRRMGKSYKKTVKKGGKRRKLRSMKMSKYASNAMYGAETKTLDGSFGGPNAPLPLTPWAANPYTPIVGQTNQTNLSLTTVGAAQCLNTQQEGAMVSQRVGNKTTMKSLKISFGLQRNATAIIAAGNTRQKCRLMIVYDRQPNLTAMNVTADLLGLISNTGARIPGTVDSNVDINNSERFLILKDYKFLAPPPNATVAQAAVLIGETGAVSTNIYIDAYIPLKNLESLYKQNTGGIGDLVTGALYIVTISDQAVGTAPWDLAGEWRLRFHDN